MITKCPLCGEKVNTEDVIRINVLNSDENVEEQVEMPFCRNCAKPLPPEDKK